MAKEMYETKKFSIKGELVFTHINKPQEEKFEGQEGKVVYSTGIFISEDDEATLNKVKKEIARAVKWGYEGKSEKKIKEKYNTLVSEKIKDAEDIGKASRPNSFLLKFKCPEASPPALFKVDKKKEAPVSISQLPKDEADKVKFYGGDKVALLVSIVPFKIPGSSMVVLMSKLHSACLIEEGERNFLNEVSLQEASSLFSKELNLKDVDVSSFEVDEDDDEEEEAPKPKKKGGKNGKSKKQVSKEDDQEESFEAEAEKPKKRKKKVVAEESFEEADEIDDLVGETEENEDESDEEFLAF